ncbi:MAG: stage 0 sporulation protein [Clostridiales bacterium]|nr:stage 0 sporulation protein [Clostridiales bacterium]
MKKVVNLSFREGGKTTRYTCEGIDLKPGDRVMAQNQGTLDLGTVIGVPMELDDNLVSNDTEPVLRLATSKEIERGELKKVKEKEAYDLCLELIGKHNLDMNLLDAVFTFDGKKVTFFFTSDNRVDFRELVKDLVSSFRARIELRQIGSRDQAKLVGGIGMCGRELCCCTFLNKFAPVTLRTARDQGMSLNPGKLNGACGRLMCCLQFEKEAYADARKRLPKQGKKIRTPDGMGVVADVNYIAEKVTVKFVEDDTFKLETYDWEGLAPLNHDMNPGCPHCPRKQAEDDTADYEEDE